MLVRVKNIISILEELEISFQMDVSKESDDEYVVASLFEPIEYGFYFAKEDINVPSIIKYSLLLVDRSIKKNKINRYIVLSSQDPQQVYYLILNKLFSLKSNGKISNTSVIHPNASIGNNVQIDEFCVIGKCKIGDNVIIGSHTKIYDNTTIGNNTIIESLSCIGTQGVAWTWNENQTQRIVQPQLGGVKVGKNCFLGANTIIVRGSANEDTEIGDNSLLAPSSRLGHGTKLGRFVHFANNIATGGNTVIGDYSFVGSGAIFRPKTKLHPKTIVGAGALVIKNTTKENMTLIGAPAKEIITKENPAGMPKPKL